MPIEGQGMCNLSHSQSRGGHVYASIMVSELNITPCASLVAVVYIRAMAGLCIHSNSCQMSTNCAEGGDSKSQA